MKLSRTGTIALALAALASVATAQDHRNGGSGSHQSAPHNQSQSRSYNHSENRSYGGNRSESGYRNYGFSNRSTTQNNRSYDFGRNRTESSNRSFGSSNRDYGFGSNRSFGSTNRESGFGSNRSYGSTNRDNGFGSNRSYGSTSRDYDFGRSRTTGSYQHGEGTSNRTWNDHGWGWSRGENRGGSAYTPYHGGQTPGRNHPTETGPGIFNQHQFDHPGRFSENARAYNFSSREAQLNGWATDHGRFELRVHGFAPFQRSEWGGHWRYGYYAPWLPVGFGFAFGLYCFTPFTTPCYVSPWYYYPCLPAYVPESAVTVVPDYYCPWNIGAPYAYQPDAGDESYGDPALNEAIQDITTVFAQMKPDAIHDVLPDGGQVAIFTDGKYDYSLNAEDFHNMVADNASITPTISFEVQSVRKTGDGEAEVRCVHAFKNEDGSSDRVYQEYRLQEREGRYQITDFMTSHTPFPGSGDF